MKRICTLLLLVVAFFISGMGQVKHYYGPELYGLKGPVKVVEMKNQPDIAVKKKIEFMESGLIRNSWLTFDSVGYPIGKDMNGLGRSEIVDIVYDSVHKPLSVSIKGNMPGLTVAEILFEYDGDDMVGMTVNHTGKKKSTDKYIFAEQQKDQYGNWVSRKVVKATSYPPTANKETKSEEYIETREIEYY
ncbi:MAG: hypothetical protein K2M56_01455 [Muribaculaceae bacterium]|nr:hypothetical protein [Muribaculaceae bacterium]